MSDDEEDEDSAVSKDTDPNSHPPFKKARHESLPYEIPTAMSVKAGAQTILAPHLNLARSNGANSRIKPYASTKDEHFVTIFVRHEDDE